MLYDPDEFIFLCAFLDALRDALHKNAEFENGSVHYAELAQAVRENDLPPARLEQIKEALIYGTFLDSFLQNCDMTKRIQELRVRTLMHTIRLLKEAAP